MKLYTNYLFILIIMLNLKGKYNMVSSNSRAPKYRSLCNLLLVILAVQSMADLDELRLGTLVAWAQDV